MRKLNLFACKFKNQLTGFVQNCVYCVKTANTVRYYWFVLPSYCHYTIHTLLLVSYYKGFVDNTHTMSHLVGISFCWVFLLALHHLCWWPLLSFHPLCVCVCVHACICVYIRVSKALRYLSSWPLPTHSSITALTGCQVPKRLFLGFLWEFGSCVYVV